MIVYVVVGAISYTLFMNCSANTSGLDSLNCIKYSIPLVIATAPVYERMNDFLLNGAIFLINAIIWFLVGSVIGLIYGKVKSRSVGATMN